MVRTKLERALLLGLVSVFLAVTPMIGCNKGNTNGENGGDTSIGDQFVSDGGAGGTISIDIVGNLTVGGTVGFFVTLRDPSGAPLEFNTNLL